MFKTVKGKEKLKTGKDKEQKKDIKNTFEKRSGKYGRNGEKNKIKVLGRMR